MRIRVRECDGAFFSSLKLLKTEHLPINSWLKSLWDNGTKGTAADFQLPGKNWSKGKPWVPTMLEGRVFGILTPIPRWWFQFYFFISFPIAGEMIQFDIYFSEGGSNTNQINVSSEIGCFRKMWLTELPASSFQKIVLNFILVDDTQLACSRLWHTEQTC